MNLQQHELWYAVGKTAAILAYIGGGHYIADLVTVARLTPRQVITTGGERYWRYTARHNPLQRVGNQKRRYLAPDIPMWRLVPLDNRHVQALAEKGRIHLPAQETT